MRISSSLISTSPKSATHYLDRFPGVKVGQSEPMSTLLACLDHERLRVSILRSTTDEHRTAHAQVA